AEQRAAEYRLAQDGRDYKIMDNRTYFARTMLKNGQFLYEHNTGTLDDPVLSGAARSVWVARAFAHHLSRTAWALDVPGWVNEAPPLGALILAMTAVGVDRLDFHVYDLRRVWFIDDLHEHTDYIRVRPPDLHFSGQNFNPWLEDFRVKVEQIAAGKWTAIIERARREMGKVQRSRVPISVDDNGAVELVPMVMSDEE
ncbi:hypothetical protein CERSUDRAFT_78729, partial [Gelatoporia subvermispora B]